MNKNIFAKALLFLIMLLVASTSWAARPPKERFADNTKVGINFGFGCPYVWSLADKNYKDLPDIHDIQAPSHISLGVMLGYSFPLANDIRIGPENKMQLWFYKKNKMFF